MADKKLESITFPGLQDRYVVKPDIADVTGLQTALDGKADKNGVYDEMVVGIAKSVIDLDQYTEDSDPYLFASMPQGAGKVLTDELVGAKVAWNQLVQTSSTSVTVQSGHKYYANINGTKSIGASNGSAIAINDGAKDNVVDLTLLLGSTIADHIYSLEQGTAGAGVAFFTKYFGNGYRPYDAGSLQGALVSGHKMVGVNQWDEEWEVGSYTVTTGEKTTHSSRVRTKNPIPILPSTTYYARAKMGTSVRLLYYDENHNYITYTDWTENNTFNTPVNARYLCFMTNDAYGATYNHDICINISNADINGKYFPYEEHTYDIEPEDLNGIFKLVDGELKANGDVRHADGTKDVLFGIVDLGSLEWERKTGEFSFAYFSSAISGKKVGVEGTAMMCVPFVTRITTGLTDASDKTLAGSASTTSIFIRDDSYSTAEAFKTAMSGVYLVYPLATPTTDTAEPFEEYQRCNSYGTQEYLLDDSQTVPIPAGHNTKYYTDPIASLMARIEALENAES